MSNEKIKPSCQNCIHSIVCEVLTDINNMTRKHNSNNMYYMRNAKFKEEYAEERRERIFINARNEFHSLMGSLCFKYELDENWKEEIDKVDATKEIEWGELIDRFFI